MKERKKEEMVFGIHAVIELIESGKDVDSVMINREIKSARLTELRRLLRGKGIPSKDLPQKAFQRYSGKNHQGVIAFLSPIDFVSIEQIIPKLYEEGKTPFILILDQVTDVRNFGAICRSASCFGVDAVVIPSKNSASINDFAIKSSAGAVFHIPISRVKSLTATLEFLKNSGIAITACTEKAESAFQETDYKKPLAIMMGAEDKGIALAHLKLADNQVRIPIQGPIQSLNVSVATGVVLSEIHRQRLEM